MVILDDEVAEIFWRAILDKGWAKYFHVLPPGAIDNEGVTYFRLLPLGKYSIRIMPYILSRIAPEGLYLKKIKVQDFPSSASKNDVIAGQYSNRAILEGLYTKDNTQRLEHSHKTNFLALICTKKCKRSASLLENQRTRTKLMLS